MFERIGVVWLVTAEQKENGSLKIAEPTLGSSLFLLYWKTLHSPRQVSIKEAINAACHHLSECLVLFSIIKIQCGLFITPWQHVPHCSVHAALLNTGPNAKREFAMSCPETDTQGDYNSPVKVSLSCCRGTTNASFQSLHHKPLAPTSRCGAEGTLKWMWLTMGCVSALFEAMHCSLSDFLGFTGHRGMRRSVKPDGACASCRTNLLSRFDGWQILSRNKKRCSVVVDKI